MNKHKLIIFGLLFLAIAGALLAYLHGTTIAVLAPEGLIASKQRSLIIFASLLSLIVVLPVFGLTAFIVWKYRAGNTTARYSPEWDHSRLAEAVWWLVPLALILVLSVVTWRSSHDLDPYRPIASSAQPLTIEVVALQWKWLFIYPDQHIATVNYVRFPEHTPVSFKITSDAPMNSFWIPRLAGQVYAMSGMSTQLHIMASGTGVYRGSSANISGQGFAGMTFTAESSSQANFADWMQSVKRSPNHLDAGTYARLAAPSQNDQVAYYATVPDSLYDTIIMKYMMPTDQHTSPQTAAQTMLHHMEETD